MINKLTSLAKKTIKRYINYRQITKNRIRVANNDLEKKSNYYNIKPINETEKSKIDNLWSKYNVKLDYRWFNFYNYINDQSHRLEYYVPHDIYYRDIDTFFSKPLLAKSIDDKNLYDLFFHDIPQPKTIVRKEEDIILNDRYQIISMDEAINLCNREGQVIIKPSVLSVGGWGIRFWNSAKDSTTDLINILNSRNSFIITEVVRQCPVLKMIHPDSLNTIRIISLTIDGEVQILSSIIRMGVNGNKVDNAASGGIFCGIQDNGQLKGLAYDSTGKRYSEHPQGGQFSQYCVPNFKKCIELVKYCAPRVSKFSKLCSWDLCIDEYNIPKLIEVNLTFGDVQLHQMTNGPIFGTDITKILDIVYSNDKKINNR